MRLRHSILLSLSLALGLFSCGGNVAAGSDDAKIRTAMVELEGALARGDWGGVFDLAASSSKAKLGLRLADLRRGPWDDELRETTSIVVRDEFGLELEQLLELSPREYFIKSMQAMEAGNKPSLPPVSVPWDIQAVELFDTYAIVHVQAGKVAWRIGYFREGDTWNWEMEQDGMGFETYEVPESAQLPSPGSTSRAGNASSAGNVESGD